MPLSVGTVIAGYTIEAVLGAGGMGTVYRAAHPSLPRSDALKVLSAELSRDDTFRLRFQREADLAATLDHPNIVTVYNRGETEDGQLWIAMQYVAGSDADVEVREGRMTPQRAVRIITEVAKALDYAHERHLLHRDVKPANFLLTQDDKRVFLADFGIARALDEAVGLTQTGTVMASVAYAAPETLSGQHPDHRADIYSLGCSLYRMLTGRTPFAKPEGGMAATAAAHLTEPPPRATALVPELPPAIDAVIAKVLAKHPDQRYQSAGEFAAAAAAALDETTVRWATTPTPPPAPPAWTATHPGAPYPGQPHWPGHAPGAVTGPRTGRTDPNAALTYPTMSQPAGYPAPPAAGATEPKRSPRRRLAIAGAVAAVIVLVAALALVFLPDRAGYQAHTFEHVYGTTTLTERPQKVAAIGPGDGDAVLSLGVQPVVIGAPGSTLPNWEQQALTTEPTVLTGFTDTAAVAAAGPDVIIATGDIDQATYDKLNAVAPTITRPAGKADTYWSWQDQLTWIGQILGEEGKAAELVAQSRSQLQDLKNQNPAFTGKTIQAVTYSNDGSAAVLTPSHTADYLTALGFQYNSDLTVAPTDGGTTRPLSDMDLFRIETDVLLILRSDRLAGQGGFGGLPRQLLAYQGIGIVVDDPDTLAALADPGGYLADRYLAAELVPKLGAAVK
ncbi:serine/threonine-protein kinase [uncultured Mycolicibacterium sp.]|uniref:serine/threonine-protein kinase n=1 Tax=uncultured Mycolicibacterium sp. TaxID=2320817 RepID=UPI00262101F8|nr:serine/threonine-protein kinase [uncultured Mycolicibacterium sp.]